MHVTTVWTGGRHQVAMHRLQPPFIVISWAQRESQYTPCNGAFHQ